MKRKIFKILVPVLVLAMLIQVLFVFNASASTLSDATNFDFVISYADESAPGNVQVKLYATTDPTALITTMGATLVIDVADFELVNNSGDIVTDTYKTDSKQLGTSFPLTPSVIEDGEGLEEMGACSLASYNSSTDEMYLFICGYNVAGLQFPSSKTEVATFYLNAKDGVTPSIENMRLMMTSEFKNASACPSLAISPAEVSSKNTVFNPVADDIVASKTLNFELAKEGTVSGSIVPDNGSVDILITLSNDENEYTETITGKPANYTLEGVKEGTYTMTVSSAGSLGFKVNNIVVTANETTNIDSINLLFGDFDNNGIIAALDITRLISNLGGTDAAYDLDGNGIVAALDITIILNNSHFGKDSLSQEITLA